MDIQKEKVVSTVFSWEQEDFKALLESCKKDRAIKITLDYLKNKNVSVLEAGCGLGRVVKYLSDLGFKNVSGVEINKDPVNYLNNLYPELNIINGDILNLPYKNNFFDVVLSYGVVEHFIDGPDEAMKSIFNVLKSGGIAIITVPSFNLLRRLKYNLSFLDLRKNYFVRKIFGKKLLNKNGKKDSYYIEPQYGRFFEYRFTPRQFELICKKAGFEIIKSVPFAHIDGLFHSVSRYLVSFSNWKFKVTNIGKSINFLFKKIPFFHNHMHLCVLKKI